MPLTPNNYSKRINDLPVATSDPSGRSLVAPDDNGDDRRLLVNRPFGVAGLDSAGQLPSVALPNYISRVNGDTDLNMGQPVAVQSNKFYHALPIDGYQRVLGLVADPVIAAGGSGRAQISGVMSMPDVDWSPLIDVGGLLVPSARYFLDSTGKLTTVAPLATAAYLVPLGVALSTTDFQILLSPPVQL